MDRYYLNKNTDTNPNNDHGVHKDDCPLLPLRDYIDLGYYAKCVDAVEAAKNHYDNVDGCRQCIPECHNH